MKMKFEFEGLIYGVGIWKPNNSVSLWFARDLIDMGVASRVAEVGFNLSGVAAKGKSGYSLLTGTGNVRTKLRTILSRACDMAVLSNKDTLIASGFNDKRTRVYAALAKRVGGSSWIKDYYNEDGSDAEDLYSVINVSKFISSKWYVAA